MGLALSHELTPREAIRIALANLERNGKVNLTFEYDPLLKYSKVYINHEPFNIKYITHEEFKKALLNEIEKKYGKLYMKIEYPFSYGIPISSIIYENEDIEIRESVIATGSYVKQYGYEIRLKTP